jgi:hypothetical protein
MSRTKQRKAGKRKQPDSKKEKRAKNAKRKVTRADGVRKSRIELETSGL